MVHFRRACARYPVDIRNLDGTGTSVPLPVPSTDHHGSAVTPDWGNASGDAAENDTVDGLQVGDWKSTARGTISR